VTINAPRSGSTLCISYAADSISCLALLLLILASSVLKYLANSVLPDFSIKSLRPPNMIVSS
jgi:hypothetical protein